MLTTESTLAFDIEGLRTDELHRLYRELLRPRLIEEKMLILLRQGRISKWFSGIGQEAVSVGTVCALAPDEYILPLHRNLGIFTGRQIPLGRLFAQFQGKRLGFTKGRDRSFHFGTRAHHIVGMISHLGPQLAVADGIALAHRLAGEGKVTAVFSGDGGASEGDFHEALNVAAVWDLPVIFIIENNGYGLSTPSREQFRCRQFVEKGIGYGMEAECVDGNDVVAMYRAVGRWAAELRERPRPVLLEAMTFRMRGHEEASGVKYVPPALLETWASKDPVVQFEQFLLREGLLSEAEVADVRAAIRVEIEEGLAEAYAEPIAVADEAEEVADMYAPAPPLPTPNAHTATTPRRFVDAIALALREGMAQYPNLVLMGQDIADYGGVFKITEGLMETYGPARVRNTPLCESAILGAALGLSVMGYKSMVEMQFADFVTCGFNQIVNNLAKSHYRWGQAADVVVRLPTGAGVAAGPFHSQSTEAWFFHTPGLKIVYPATPADARGLLLAALADPNPVLFFEHKALYRSLVGEVPDEPVAVPIGPARLAAEGDDLTIVTYGMGVHWAEQLMADWPERRADIVDLRTLLPWDREAVASSVRKTGRVLVLHEACLTGGIGAEIAAWIAEHCFEHLDAPVVREGSLDTAVPFVPTLEQAFLPLARARKKLANLLTY